MQYSCCRQVNESSSPGTRDSRVADLSPCRMSLRAGIFREQLGVLLHGPLVLLLKGVTLFFSLRFNRSLTIAFFSLTVKHAGVN